MQAELLFDAGMNTGIQDAHNLAWKMASVVKGIAPSSVLNTYETERKPVLLSSFYFYSMSLFILNLHESLTFIIFSLRLQFLIQHLALKTSEQPWLFLLHLVLIQLLQIQVTNIAIFSCLTWLMSYFIRLSI